MSYWDGRNNLNDTAIGIETVNLATDNDGVFTFPPYNVTQIAAIKALASNILYRFLILRQSMSLATVILRLVEKVIRVLPFRGRHFMTQVLVPGMTMKLSNGIWISFFVACHQNDIISKLKRYGYDTSGAVSEVGYNQLIRAFQLHFRPCNYDGIPDAETVAILYALVDKYKP